MNDDDYSDYVVAAASERVYAIDDGQDFDTESLRRLTNGASEPPTDNYPSGQYGSPDHTLVYNAVYQSCRDLTACGSWDEIRSSTPNRKSKPTMHGMHLKNLSTTSINQSIIEFAPSCLSHEVGEHLLSPPNCIRSTETSLPDIPITTNKIYPPDALLTIPDQHLSTVSPPIYIPLSTLGRDVHGKVFAAQLKDNPNDKIYTLKTIPKVNLVQRGVAEVTKELEILRFITDASLSNKPFPFPFLQKLKENFQDEKNLYIVLKYFPTTLEDIETATLFRLSPKTSSPSKTYYESSEQEAIQALRFLAAELTLGLLFLHRHGIVHQDIKPANIMISEGGHAVIGEFGAASTLPRAILAGQTGTRDSFERPSCIDEDGVIYKSIVLQPEDTVIFTPLYAAPELLERKENGLLIYDERADWWSLGISLYEITTGGIPFHISSDDVVSIAKGRRRDDSENGLVFDLLEGLDLTAGSTTRACDAHLDGYLRSLLVHDPHHRLSGERAKSHPFLEPLKDIWAEIEDLRHPPCPKPPARVLYGGDTTDISFDLQEDSSKFDAQPECTQISYSRLLPESPQTPLNNLNEEYYYTPPREVLSSPEQNNSLESPPFLTRRREALAVKRPGRQRLWNDDNKGIDESGLSVILQQEAFMSYYIETSFQTNGSLSVGNPLPSTGSAGRFFSDEQSEHFYGTCTMERRDVGSNPEESFDDEDNNKARAETSFADSGLDFPLGSSPESWGHRKSDTFRKPLALRPIFEQRFQGIANDRGGGGRIHDDDSLPAKPKKVDLPKPKPSSDLWTFDEKITISLLEAGLRQQERLEPTVRTRSRLSKPQSESVAAASERIMKAAGRRVADALTRRRRQ